jgi:hypothetical protein
MTVSMTNAARVPWRIAGEEINSCNCAWGCPCQFTALPTHGQCESFIGYQIQEGHYGETRLDGVRFARIFRWPGPVHEGNGTRLLVIDERATAEQREALIALESGTQGNPNFEIFAAVAPSALEPVVAPITFEVDRERGYASLSIPDVGESRIEPIKNPVTGQDHRAKIVLPDGFEFKEAEMANTVTWSVTVGGLPQMAHQNSYAQLNAFDWTNGAKNGELSA